MKLIKVDKLKKSMIGHLYSEYLAEHWSRHQRLHQGSGHILVERDVWSDGYFIECSECALNTCSKVPVSLNNFLITKYSSDELQRLLKQVSQL